MPYSHAVPAWPELVEFQQPDGKTTLRLYLLGDEKVHWAETVDGYSLLHGEDGAFEYAVLDERGNMVPSGIMATDIADRSEEAAILLRGTNRHLRYSESQVNAMLAMWEDMSKMRVEAGRMKNVTGQKRFLVVLFEFQDRDFIHTGSEFRHLFNQIGYNANRSTGSVRDYYRAVSHNQFDLVVDVVGPYKGAYNMEHYGLEDAGYQDFAEEAVQFASADVDFSNYDNDNDGYIDGMHIIFAGYGEEAGAPAEAIWSHKWNIFSSPEYNNTIVNVYSCSPELSGRMGESITKIGVICHELGHVFGAPDYYDTDYAGSGGEYPGLGTWDIMSSGSWNNSGITPANHNPYTKIYIYQWATARVLNTPERVCLHSVTDVNTDFYQVNTSTNGDYFLIENRQRTAWDAGIPGHGMIVYHKHANANGSSVSNRTHPMQLYIVSAATNEDYPSNDVSSYGMVNGPAAAWPGSMHKDSLTDNTTPRFRAWNKVRNNKPFYHISECVEDGTVSFCFKNAQPELYGFSAEAVSNHQIRLNWKRYGTYKNIIVMSQDSIVERPQYYSAGPGRDTLPGGDIVIYRGTDGHTVIDSLTSGQTYYFHIYLSIDDTTLTNGLATSASTTMCPSTAWRHESFESNATCWNDAELATAAPRWSITQANASEGSHCIGIADNSLADRIYPAMLYAAPFRFDTVCNFVLTFDAKLSGVNTMKVIYRASPDANWDTIYTIESEPSEAAPEWRQHAISLSSASAYSRLAFLIPNMAGGASAYLDNFDIRNGYLIQTSCGEHGNIWPAGNIVCAKDDTVLIAMRGVPGYGLKSFYVNNHSMLSEIFRGVPGDTTTNRPYYLYNLWVRGNHVVHAEFGINTEIEYTSQSDKQMELYPNPTTGMATITLAATDEEVTMRIFDPTGRLMQQQKFNKTTSVDLKKMPTGCYFIHCSWSNGYTTSKLLKN
ncbi:MAG: M6 family metalloprotease domain-containing protein [Bacteroidales bacterium]|nr:M6 family metalloprotease domain-containing protein [Bacteroidales bacterium]